MQAITTKYLPATNTKGARIKATCEAGSVTISHPHGDANPYWEAARTLIVKLGWPGEWYEGQDTEGRRIYVPAAPGGCNVYFVHRVYGTFVASSPSDYIK